MQQVSGAFIFALYRRGGGVRAISTPSRSPSSTLSDGQVRLKLTVGLLFFSLSLAGGKLQLPALLPKFKRSPSLSPTSTLNPPTSRRLSLPQPPTSPRLRPSRAEENSRSPPSRPVLPKRACQFPLLRKSSLLLPLLLLRTSMLTLRGQTVRFPSSIFSLPFETDRLLKDSLLWGFQF